MSAKEYTPSTILSPANEDKTLDTFKFTDVTGAQKGTTVASDPIVVKGVGSAAKISITGGEYQIVGSSPQWTSADGAVLAGQSVQVRAASANSDDTPVQATLTIGGVSGTFTVSTKVAGGAAAKSSTPSQENVGENASGGLNITNQIPSPQ